MIFFRYQGQRNYLIEQLITWKEYVLQIAAFNEKGIGVFSEEVKVKTKEGGKSDTFF